ncbi:Phosphatidate cytidylyltransferase 1 [Dictyocoela muelleri]|nr:Phosphatidate cytidylyltransferase 1 [Dictyocoela muelleri]
MKIINRKVENPDIENSEIENPDIENSDIENPDIENSDIENPEIENSDIENPDIENPDIEKPSTDKKSTMKNSMLRLMFSIPMICIFILIMRSTVKLTILVTIIKYFSCYEITKPQRYGNRVKMIMNFLGWYFIVVSDIYLSQFTLMKFNSDHLPEFVLQKTSFACFLLYLIGTIIFIMSLKKKTLKNQFAHLAVIHLAILVGVIPSHLAINIIFKNRMWFFICTSLVIVNDIAAYLVGKSIGKTQLIKLSPKKTVEGFIGASIATFIWGYLIIYFEYFMLPELREKFGYFKIFSFFIPKLYFHILPFIFFAGFVAPFGGFFASAYKRTFKLKDFSGVIPGHGGVTDRVDCQVLMIFFTYTYLMTFLRPKKTVEEIVHEIIRRYSSDDILKISKMLRDFVVQ